jgi:DNA-binding NarL/FixJ family response regulator
MADAGTSKTIQVLVVDDHPLMLSGVAALVRRQPEMHVCGEAVSAEDAIEQAICVRPDVIVLDLRLRGGVQNGIELASTLVAILPGSRVIAYSGHLTDSGIRDLIRAGVASYLPKTAHPDQLALAIRTLAAGGRFGIYGSVGNTQGATLLTERELTTIQLLSEGRENDEIAERMSLSPSAVRLCLTAVFAKLGARNRTEAVVQAHRRRLITID